MDFRVVMFVFMLFVGAAWAVYDYRATVVLAIILGAGWALPVALSGGEGWKGWWWAMARFIFLPYVVGVTLVVSGLAWGMELNPAVPSVRIVTLIFFHFWVPFTIVAGIGFTVRRWRAREA